ncbi:4485_t:CDS:2 [Diversispora eburnea]|uniref:4485_t:CDS:1 n=1 Tax=Diversispora eburnea TaxID=1213867 RepID=A0A9N8Z9E1_9GLOM|nr:4485_t:CDS:2 [Diversispora eburnea]
MTYMQESGTFHTNQAFTLEVESINTVSHVKQQILDLTGYEIITQKLYYFGDLLEDKYSLDRYNIQKDSTLHLKIEVRDVMKINIEIKDSEKKVMIEDSRLSIEVEKSMTIEELKQKVQKLHGFQSNSQSFYFFGVHLEDYQRLMDYKIQNDSNLHLSLCSGGCNMRIYIEIKKGKVLKTSSNRIINTPTTSKIITLEVKSFNTIAQVKQKIKYSEADIKYLFYFGEQLDDNLKLWEYNIQNESTLHVRFYYSKYKIFVRNFSGQFKSLLVNSMDDIYQVKKLIQEIEGFHPDQQRLIWAGKQLVDENTLADYGIEKESTIHLVPRTTSRLTKKS